MSSKRRHEGYLLIDNRESPGVPAEMIHAANKAGKVTIDPGRGLYESATITCNHCKTIVIINPERTRERAWCAKCDHYICDGCGAVMAKTGVCRPFKKLIDEVYDSLTS